MLFLRNLGTYFLYSQYLLNGPNAYKYERMSGDELANIVICKRITAIMVSPLFLCYFGPIRLILAGNVDIHTILDDFEFPPDPMTEYGDIARSCDNEMGPD